MFRRQKEDPEIARQKREAENDQISEMQTSLDVQTRDALRFYGARSALAGSSGRGAGRFMSLGSL